MNRKKEDFMKKLLFSMTAFLAVAFMSCEEDKNARLEVWLTDAPARYEAVKVDVQGVEIHSNENDNDRGWQSLNITPQIYDLLTLTNGEEAKLGDLELPGGRVSQIRLILGDNNTVVVDGTEHPLATPSAQQSGLKLQLNQVLSEGVTYKLVLDFDAARSIVETGDGTYSLKPVIRVFSEATTGAIKGVVDPAGEVNITVKSGDEVVATTISNEDGGFLIRGLGEGSYTVEFESPEGGTPVVKTIEVSVGEVADLGTVTLTE